MPLRKQVLSGVRYSALTNLLQFFFALVVAVIMARLLDPKVFGLIAMASVFTAVNEIFVDFGTRDAIIRHEKIDEFFLSSIFWFNTGLSIFIFLMMLLIGRFIANFYGYPIIRLIVYVMSIKIIFSAMGIVPKAILMRKMNFRAFFFQKIFILPITGIIGILLAFHGFGVWSLVVHQVLTVISGTVLIWIYSAWYPKIYFNLNHIRQIFSFSSYLSLTKFSNYFTKKGDLFLIGKFLGATALGFYSKGYGLFVKQLKLINNTIIPVLFTAISKIQNDKSRLRSTYLQSSQILAVVYFPLCAGSIFLAEPFLILLLGEKWRPVVPLIPIFATMLIFISQGSISSHYLKALGKTRELFSIVLLSSVVTIISFVIGLRWGIKGVATAYCFSIIFQYIVLTLRASRLINLSMLKILLNLKMVVFNFLVMTFVIYITFVIISYLNIDSNLLNLICGGTTGIFSYVIISWFSNRKIFVLLKEFIWLDKIKVPAS